MVWLLLWALALWTAVAQAQVPLFGTAQTSGGLGVGASSAVVTTPRVRAELVAYAPEGVQPAGEFHLGLLIEHAAGWHTYWKNPGDSGMATELHWQLPAGLEAGPVEWPTPLKLRIGDLANYGYENRVLLPVRVVVAPDWQPQPLLDLQLQATWLVCKLECIPEQGSFRLQLPAQGATGLMATEFQQAWRDRPQPLAPQGSTAAARGDQLQLRLEGLPPQWRGQKLELFVEAPLVLRHGARAVQDWQQRWDGAVWLAEAPLAPDRQASEDTLAVVVTRLSRSEGGDWDPQAPPARPAAAEDGAQPKGWRIEVPVTAGWQGVVWTPPSPALLQALADNQEQGATALAPVAGPTSVPAGSAWSMRQWALMLGFALLGGALLNLMPCVFPVLAIKALAVARHGGDRTLQLRSAWAYGAGVLLSFVALGALVLALRAAGLQLGWGFQLQSPWFVAALALLFTWMGLALAGVGGTGQWLPAGWRQGSHSGQGGSPVAQSFATGVLAVLVASPCTGPFMGAALGATLTLPAAAALAVFAAIGIGMALPFMVLVWLPQLLQRLPRPGAWMETFRTAMAFPMFATVVWLLWVLANQVGSNGMAGWLFVLWALSGVLWLLGKRPARAQGMALQGLWLLGLAVPLAIGVAGARHFSASAVAPPAPPSMGEAAAQGWGEWSPQAQQHSLQQGRPVFVDFTASWCITCQYNKMTTLADAQVLADFAAAGVQLLRADWTRQNPAITAELQALGRNGVPTYALHAPGQPVQVMTEILDKAELRAQLAQVAEVSAGR